MKLPGPDHPITLTPAPQRWRAKYAGHVIADSDNAIVLQEADYPAVVYFPKADVSMEYMGRTPRSTHCPYKGDASYFTVTMDGHIAENAVWSYELPYPAMEQIAERLAFYTDKIEVYAVDDAEVNPHPHDRTPSEGEDFTITVDDVVLHTDSGSGNSQRQHWPANVSTPETTDDGGLR
jgi:uncharacterized protein (DUF427 family)